tara:strand:+ start:952 stop:1227 length:276 start_codon:yes stop_codon:yes gene_type:complete
MRALTGNDRIKRITKKRFRKMTPEELEEAQAAGEIPKGRQDEFYEAMIADAQEKGDAVREKKFQNLYDELLKEEYAKKRKRTRKRIRAPKL